MSRASPSNDPTPADAEQLAQWFEFCARHPGELPAEVAPVQTRLIRAVGRGTLPSGDGVYLKTMGFPRARDRWRYWLRALPAAHEAAMLRAATTGGVPCPAVLGEVTRRRGWGMPHASVLATAALAVVEGRPPGLRECAELARRLAEVGIAHRDLHAGNFVRLQSGGCAVLDLQSAQRPRGTVARLPLAARLLASEWPRPERPDAVVATGLIGASDLPAALARAQALRRDAVRRRVERCRIESSEFAVTLRAWGRLTQRRVLPAGGTWLEVGREGVRIWVGARFLEVVEREPSPLMAMCERGTRRRRCSVYFDVSLGASDYAARRAHWIDAHRRFTAMCAARQWPSLSVGEPLPWSGLPVERRVGDRS